MRAARLIHAKHVDRKRRRFSSQAFNNSSDGSGISIVDRECVDNHGDEICAHISKFYPGQVGDPIIFWEIPADIIPSYCKAEPEPSETGDDCHYNIKGWGDKEARDVFIRLLPEAFEVCDQSGPRPLTQTDIDLIISQSP